MRRLAARLAVLLLFGAGGSVAAQEIPVTSWDQAREQLRAGEHHAVVWHLRQGNLRPEPGNAEQSFMAGVAYFEAAAPLALRELSGAGLSEEASSLVAAATSQLEAAQVLLDSASFADREILTGAVETRLHVLRSIAREAEIVGASGAGGSSMAPIVAEELLTSVRENGAIARAVFADLTEIREGIVRDARAIDALELEIANFQKRIGELRDAILQARVRFEAMMKVEEGEATRPAQLVEKLEQLDAELARFAAIDAGEALSAQPDAAWPEWDADDFPPLEVLQHLAGAAPRRVLQAREEAERLLRQARREGTGEALAPGLSDLVSDEFDFSSGMELQARLDELEALLKQAEASSPGAGR